MPDPEDLELSHGLELEPAPWDGLITTDSSMLIQWPELAALIQTNLTLFVAVESGHKEIQRVISEIKSPAAKTGQPKREFPPCLPSGAMQACAGSLNKKPRWNLARIARLLKLDWPSDLSEAYWMSRSGGTNARDVPGFSLGRPTASSGLLARKKWESAKYRRRSILTLARPAI